MRGFRAVLVAAAVALVSARAPAARAEPPAAAVRDVVVVEVDAGSSGVDAAALRTAIGSELGADAVAPDDERASRAHGTIAVSIDRAAGVLVVSYREKGAPIVRRIELPASPDATLRAAVLLAGNLARDEAAELTEMLRKKAPARRPSAGPLGPEELVEDEAAIRQAEMAAGQDVELMGPLLDRYARHHRTLRTVISVVGDGVALGAGVATWYLLLRPAPLSQEQLNGAWVLLGSSLSLFTVSAFIAPPTRWHDELKEYYEKDRESGRPAALVRQDMESLWLRQARREHKWRIISSVAGFVIAGLEVGTLAVLGSLDRSFWQMAPFFAQPAAASVAAGFVPLAAPGPAESSLRAYERATGRSVWGDAAPKLQPVLSPTLGGVTVGFGGRF